ncbi:hypothetical protein C5167_016835 [Papaver somniferum]|uniref:Sulfotransferase n=1 Tax=Papaver somniferum TaxID=3469 RepID=A0A4Y7ILR8_PAPSO|nr:hypothetical protein C5167_016835 [Papaver somniferum]
MAEDLCLINNKDSSFIIKVPKKSPLVSRMVLLLFAMICGVYICSICLKQINTQSRPKLVVPYMKRPCPAPAVEKGELRYLHYPKPVTYEREECACNPVRYFAILSMQRSGSGWFETLLNSHINVSSNGEIFSNKERRSNISSIVNTLDKVYNLDWFSSASKNECSAAVGFKWMLNQSQDPRRRLTKVLKCVYVARGGAFRCMPFPTRIVKLILPSAEISGSSSYFFFRFFVLCILAGLLAHQEQIVEYFNRRGVSAVFLFRRNLLRRLISVLANNYDRDFKLLNGTHKSHVHSHHQAEILAQYKPTINATLLINNLKVVEDTTAKALEYFNSTRHIIVYYEDLISNKTKLAEVQGFLRVPLMELKSRQVKIHKGSLADHVQNWDDVNKTLTGTPYERYLYADYEM